MVCRAEIAFYSQDRASVFVESDDLPDMQSPLELGLFVHYVVRQFANFGPGDASAYGLAQAMSKVGYEPGQESIREVLGTVQVVPATGRGRKGFVALFDGEALNLKHHGFGLIGRGIGYYAPMSAMVLMDSLWSAHSRDNPFLTGLLMACMQMSQIGHLGNITPANQVQYADSILSQALPVYERVRAEEEASGRD